MKMSCYSSVILFSVLFCVVVQNAQASAWLGEPCVTSDDCNEYVPHLYCSYPYRGCTHGVCACDSQTYVPYDDDGNPQACTLAVDIDGECEGDQDCTAITGNSLCVNGVCACDAEEKLTIVNGKNYCYKSLAGEECSRDDDCLSYHINFFGRCAGDVTGSCQCITGYRLNGEICEMAQHGEDCSIDGSMQEELICMSNTMCLPNDNSKTCQCAPRTAWDANRHVCIHNQADDAVELEQLCNTDYLSADGQICISGLTCDTCPAGDPDQRCREQPHATIGESCLLDSDCSVAYSECTMQYMDCDAGICTCGTGYYPYEGECHLAAAMHDPCKKDEDCLAMTLNSFCRKDRLLCACEDDEWFSEVDGQPACFAAAAGVGCGIDDDCLTHHFDPQYGRCIILEGEDRGTCGCQRSVLDAHQNRCVPVDYASSCGSENATADCIGNTECIESGSGFYHCLCPVDLTLFDLEHDQCIHEEATTRLPLGEPCNNLYLEPEGRMCNILADFVCAQCSDSEELLCREAVVPEPEDDDGAGASSVTYSLLLFTMTTIFAWIT